MKKLIYAVFVIGVCSSVQAESTVSGDGGFIPPGECTCPVDVTDAAVDAASADAAVDAAVDASADADILDAGACTCPDASVGQPDSSVSTPDAAVSTPDASTGRPDATASEDKPGSLTGGGCSIKGAPSASLALALMAALVVRRRRAA